MRLLPIGLPARVLAVVAAVAGCSALVFAAALAVGPVSISRWTALTGIFLTAVLLVARRYPVHLTERTKTSVATVPLFAAALLLPLSSALIVSALGIAAAETWRRGRWFQTAFNTSSGVLQVGAAGGVFRLLAGAAASGNVDARSWVLPALAAACALFSTGLLLVELMVSVQLQRVTLRQFWQRIWISLPQEGLLSLLGLVLAVVTVEAPIAIPLVAAPGYLVYRSLVVMACGLSSESAATAPAHLAQLPRQLQLTIVLGVAAASAGVFGTLLTASLALSPGRCFLALLIAGLAAASYRLPIKPAPKRSLVLDGSLIMVAVIALTPGLALLTVAAASVLGNAVLRRPWFNILFNAAQRVLAALAAIAVYQLLAPAEPASVTGTGLLAATAAACVYWATSVTLVDLISAVQLRRSPLRHWFPTHRQSLLAHALLLPLGIFIAPATSRAPWLVAGLLLPAVLVRVLVRSALQFDVQTDLLVDDLLAAEAANFPALARRSARLSSLALSLATAYGLPDVACRQISLTARLAAAADTLLQPEAAVSSRARGASHNARAAFLTSLVDHPQVAEILDYRRSAYDGSSDPAGPRGAAIPIGARVLALSEGWLQLDAGHETGKVTDALTGLIAGAGSRWDPELVGLLARVLRQSEQTLQCEAA